ncbi:MAG: TIGR01459 family HAD-type hydrolase, partial [Gammaproteobacteria bacterium]
MSLMVKDFAKKINSETKKISGLVELTDQYDVFLIDVCGVVHDGINAYDGVPEAINHLMDLKKEVVFLSNAPRPSSVIYSKLK